MASTSMNSLPFAKKSYFVCEIYCFWLGIFSRTKEPLIQYILQFLFKNNPFFESCILKDKLFQNQFSKFFKFSFLITFFLDVRFR